MEDYVLLNEIHRDTITHRKAVYKMSNKSANIVARVEPEVKEEAEAILGQIGIPASVAINMFYKQIILEKGIPFKPHVPYKKASFYDDLTEDDFNQRMALGLMQAKKGEGRLADDVFNDLLSKLEELKHDR